MTGNIATLAPRAVAARATPEQRTAATPGSSVWVTASAGSGKTRVLVERLLRLMLAGTPPARLLCVTFTKAAAAEMANRLHRQLAEWTMMGDDDLRQTLHQLTGQAPSDDDLAPARRIFARVLETPGGLKIQTIHSFCESLLARFPLEADLPPQFRVMDDRTAAELLDEARNDVIAAIQKGAEPALSDALDVVTSYVGEVGFAKVMAALAGARGNIRRAMDRHGGFEGLIAATRQKLGFGAGETEDSLLHGACADAAFDGANLRRIAEAMLQSSGQDGERGKVLADWLAHPGTRADNFEGYAGVYLTSKDALRKRLATKATEESEPDAIAVLLVEAERVLQVNERLKALSLADRTEALLRLGEALLRAYEDQKRLHAYLDYDDLILLTQRLLSQSGVAPWVLYKLDGGIDHILVDEAQDTSPHQWDVIAALAEEFFAGAGAREVARTVFVVGDEKQSIYSFQGADPAAFEKMRGHFRDRVTESDQDWKTVPLLHSFRSVPAILFAVDEIFKDDEVRAGVTTGAESIRHVSNREGASGIVELWPTFKPGDLAEVTPWEPPLRQEVAVSPESQLAARIAGRIKHWLQSGEELRARGRPIRPGDIMILVRRRNAFFEEMVRTLKQRGIPVAGTDRMVLTEQLAVMDLIALGRFVLLPEDDLTLAIVLKGPLFGFDDSRLFDLAYGRSGTILWDRLKTLSAKAADFAQARERLAELLAIADFVSPFEFFADVLSTGGRKQILSRLGAEANDPIDEFLASALAFERDHVPSLERFLHWLEAGQKVIKRDLEQGKNEVRVMTVHGAKGLEAPIVFLPDTCATPQERDAFLWTDDGDDSLLLWAVRQELEEGVSRAAQGAAQRRRIEEYRRLLYVALTRAEDRLYICGWETKRGRGRGCWYDAAADVLYRIAEQVEVDFGEPDGPVKVIRYEGPQSAATDGTETAPVEIYAEDPLPDWASALPPAEPAPPRPLAPSRPAEDEPPVQSPLGGDAQARFRRGSLIHHLLQTLPDLPRDRRAAAAQAFVARPGGAFSEAEQAEIVAETLSVLDDPRFGRLFEPDALAEAPIAGLIGGYALSGQIDRLLVTDDEVLIVDYKTNRDPPEDEAAVSGTYVRQMAAYRMALQSIYPERPVRCALLWTQGPRLMELSAESLDRAAP